MAYDIPHLRELDRFLPATRTTRPDIARSHLAAIFADHDLRLSAGRVDFSHRQARLCDTLIGMLRYGTEVEIVAPPLDCYMAQLTLEGEVAFRTDRFEIGLKPGTLFVMNPGVSYRKTWSRDAHQLMIKIPRQRLTAHATRAIRFAPVASQMDEADGLIGLIAHLCRDLANARGLSAHACLRRKLEDLFLSALIATQPRDTDDDAPEYLRRAEGHIRAHVGRSIDVSEMVAVTGVSERTLQQAFQRYRGCTPLDYARNVRLDAAHAALLAGDGGGVTQVALAFGFAHFGRFAQAYASRFGEKPSETLKRVRH
ncbi:AraC family transcriptional regulator [Pseudorhodoplanes sp.]|uniref:AraC family transcriptional regulator n=1 Tax=Pseudorhodoplanes sp. TaxID=1934341 RepID=UPI002C50F7A3|nr:AraC family transcriptional regulator [Pseudorhodoplanes sp.]HWV53646.1 AraC family transcriptional regulator [Pseudorhodoplanes sp.]